MRTTARELDRAAQVLAGAPLRDRRAALAAAERRRHAACLSDLARTDRIDDARAARIAAVAKAVSDPVRVGLLDVVRRNPTAVCQCDLQPLFGVAQPTLSHHLGKLVEAGLLDVERRGRWAYYSAAPGALNELRAWLS